MGVYVCVFKISKLLINFVHKMLAYTMYITGTIITCITLKTILLFQSISSGVNGQTYG